MRPTDSWPGPAIPLRAAAAAAGRAGQPPGGEDDDAAARARRPRQPAAARCGHGRRRRRGGTPPRTRWSGGAPRWPDVLPSRAWRGPARQAAQQQQPRRPVLSSARRRRRGWAAPPRSPRPSTGARAAARRAPMFPAYQLARTIPGPRPALTACAFNKAGERLVTCGYDQTCKVRALTVGHGSGRHIIQNSSSDSMLLVPPPFQVWDTATGQPLLTLAGHRHAVFAAAFNNPYGDVIASGSFDGSACLWDARTGRCLFTGRGPRWSAWGSTHRYVRGNGARGRGHLVSTHGIDPFPHPHTTTGHALWRQARWTRPSGCGTWNRRRLQTLGGHRGGGGGAAVRAGRRGRLVSGSFDRTARVWTRGRGAAASRLWRGTRGSSRRRPLATRATRR